MKRAAIVIATSFLTLILGAIALIPVNGWIWKMKGFEGGYDDEMKMFDILVFIEWPILLLLGAFLGNLIYKKYLR